jgi:hypothetical protein
MQSLDEALQVDLARPEPQRLLAAFAAAKRPAHASPTQREAFEHGEGGALALLPGVNRLPAPIDLLHG